jgi:hypothetical protein
LACVEFALVGFIPSGDTTNENNDTSISDKLTTSDHETSNEIYHQED